MQSTHRRFEGTCSHYCGNVLVLSVGKKAPRLIYQGETKILVCQKPLWLSGSRSGNMQPHCMDSDITKYNSAMDKLASLVQKLCGTTAE